MRSHLTIRGLPEEVADRLEAERRRRGESLNQTVIELLRHALGLESGQRYENGLRRFAGTWSEEEFEEFEANTLNFEEVDPDLWS